MGITRCVGEVIDSAHAATLAKIDAEIQKLAADLQHETIDDFDASALFDISVLISQYCAYKDNYEEISADDLISIIEKHKDKLFIFEITQQEKPFQVKVLKDIKKTVTEYIDGLVLDDQGRYRTGKIAVLKEAWVKEEVEETQTVMVATFTVTFVGADYFASEVFRLDEEKTAYANDLAQNLAIFLGDFYDENVPSNGTHGRIRANENVQGLGYDDLYQEGCLALCHAAQTFNGSVQFKTYAQGRHYMAVMNIDTVFFACLFGNNEGEFVYRKVERDHDQEADLIAQEQFFWKEYVLKNVEPPYTESGDLVLESIRRHYGEADADVPAVFLPAALASHLEEYLALSGEKSALSKRVRDLENAMKRAYAPVADAMGTDCAAICKCGGMEYTVTFKSSCRTAIGKDGLEPI